MITTRSFKDQNWIDLNGPTKEEAESLILTQDIDPHIAKDLLSPTPIQHFEDRNNNVYMVLHLPTFSRQYSTCEIQEADIVISAKNLITARYDSIDALHFFAKQMEVNDILNKNEDGHVFFSLMREIYNALEDELAFMEDQIKIIEKNIFEGYEKDMVFAISKAGRNILNFKRIVDPHGNIFELLKEAGLEKFGPKFATQTKILIEDWRHIMHITNNQIDLIAQLRETNNSMLSTKQNEIMKQLAVIGSIMLPLTIIGQVFGLSINRFPFKEDPNAFWFVLAIMVIVMMFSFIFAKIKKWM